MELVNLKVEPVTVPGRMLLNTPLRVLLVEDSDDDARLLIRHLRHGGYEPTFERVETADGLRAALHRGGWDLIVSDYSLPRFSGLEALAIALQLAPDVPFLVVSGTVGEEVAVESIKAGAADYLMKQNMIRFVPTVARALRDAAERRAMRRAEAVLREQRSLLGMIYDNTSDAIALYSWEPQQAEWRLTRLNRATILLLRSLEIDASEDDLLRRSPEVLVRDVLQLEAEAAELVLTSFYETSEMGRSRTHEVQVVRNAKTLYAEVTLIPFFGPDGNGRHLLTVVRDITERRRAEDARRDLELRAAQSRKMEALGQLAGGVAHDFNNILTAILGFAEVIRSSTTEPTVVGFSDEIVTAAQRARELVRQILMFSRRQTGERRPVRPGEIVREALKLIRQSAPPTIQIGLKISDHLPYVLGDATQLHQVLMNLCINAVQAMGASGGRLDVVLEPIDITAELARRYPPLREGLGLRLTVSDTGPGMSQTVLERLFEPFFTTKAPGVGTGLGLSVVHGIVQNHEGAIVVESSPGIGTTFHVYLPGINSPSWPGDVAMTDRTASTSGLRILFVDDEPSIARLAQVMLKTLGHTAVIHANAEEAIEALRAAPTAYDLVITDLTMPGMNGIEFARAIRGIRADLPIILSSGFVEDVPDETLSSLGIVEVLQKPFQMQALNHAIQRAGNPL